MKTDDKFLILLKDFIIQFTIMLIAAILITQFIFYPVRVDGSSMYPSLEDHEIGFSNILSLKMGGVERFDVVVVALENPNKSIVKRVIGLPGETVEVKDEVLYINGVVTEQPFLDTEYVNNYIRDNKHFTIDIPAFVVPEGTYYALGDNRPRSSDSRDYGPFEHGQIKSKSVFIFYPLNKIRNVGNYSCQTYTGSQATWTKLFVSSRSK